MPLMYHYRGSITLDNWRSLTGAQVNELQHYLKEIGVFE